MTSVTRGSDRAALAAVCLSALMFGLEISSVPTILPTLAGVLHADFANLQWIMNAYTIAVTSVLMASGTLADRYGRKRLFVGAIFLFGIASLFCGFAQDASMLILARCLQGASGGAMLIAQIAVLAHQFPSGARRARAFAAWGIVFGVGLGFGPLIGAGIMALLDWRWVFLAHVLLAVLTIGLAAAGVQESRDPDAKHLDLAGIVTLSGSVLCLAFYITEGPELGFMSGVAVTTVGVAILSFLAFLFVETRSRRPMFDFSVFQVRAFSGALLGSIGMNFGYWPFIIYLPIFFRVALGYGNFAAGLCLLPYTLPTLVVPPLGERLLVRFSARLVIPGGLAVIALGFLLMWAGAGAEHPDWLTLLPGCLTAGIGLGVTNTPVTNTTTASVPVARAGMASSIDMSARMISLAINIALMGFIVVSGVAQALRGGTVGALDPNHLQALAEAVAGGSADLAQSLPPTALRSAVLHGFRWVMLYAMGAVLFLALLSRLVFGAEGKAETPFEELERHNREPRSATGAA